MSELPWRTTPLDGFLDFHVHTAPDVRPRWHSAMELAEHARAAHMAGFVVKSHHEPTVLRAAEVRKRFPQLRVYGGVTLNRAAGGIDAQVVAKVLSAGGRVVWLPTLDGRGQRNSEDGDDGLRVANEAGEVEGELLRIFELIAAADAVLATGHISAEEILPVVRAARRASIRRILINHPEIHFLRFSIDLQKQLRDEGALLERCYPRPEAKHGFEQMAQEMREVGVQSTILATDLGRRDLPPPVEGLRRIVHELRQRGFSAAEVATAARENPTKLLKSGR